MLYDLLLAVSALASVYADVTRPLTRAERAEANRLVFALAREAGITFPAWGAYADVHGLSLRDAAALVSYLDDAYRAAYDASQAHCAGGCGVMVDLAGAVCAPCAVAELEALLCAGGCGQAGDCGTCATCERHLCEPGCEVVAAPQADAPARVMPARDERGRFLPARTYTFADMA